ncbi:hypothetical protein LC612_37350, partial [Nostoc sp. CHAB 5834]|nr:hypothetical protein [Nostoc sp. CHAB 5834]
KYDYFEHAERNAIYNLARQTLAGSTALCTAPPDISSARALISVGVSAVYWLEPEDVENEESLSFCKALFREAGIAFCNFKRIDEMDFNVDRLTRKLSGNMQFTLAMSELMSKDPKRSGALFLNKDYTTLTEGYSGQPRGANDDLQTRYSGAERATWVESSIRNAIYNLVRPILRGSVLTVTFTTCVECARAAVAVGAQSVVYREPNEDFLSRWGDSVKEALAVLKELQVPAHGIRIED